MGPGSAATSASWSNLNPAVVKTVLVVFSEVPKEFLSLVVNSGLGFCSGKIFEQTFQVIIIFREFVKVHKNSSEVNVFICSVANHNMGAN